MFGGTKDMQGLKRKMERCKTTFQVEGRGKSAVFKIKEITEPFKTFCITELGVDGRTDFNKLLYFLYYYFNDDEFRAMPDEVKEFRMTNNGNHVSRQTIATYIAKLDRKGLIDRNTNKYIYYFAFKQEQRLVERPEYLQAWHEYWNNIDNGYTCPQAINKMREDYGGVARKQPQPEINGIYIDEIKYLCTLIQEAIEKEVEGQN